MLMNQSYVIRESLHFNSLHAMLISSSLVRVREKAPLPNLKPRGGPQEGTLHFCGRRQVLLHAY